jgi:hypothetical protein
MTCRHDTDVCTLGAAIGNPSDFRVSHYSPFLPHFLRRASTSAATTPTAATSEGTCTLWSSPCPRRCAGTVRGYRANCPIRKLSRARACVCTCARAAGPGQPGTHPRSEPVVARRSPRRYNTDCSTALTLAWWLCGPSQGAVLDSMREGGAAQGVAGAAALRCELGLMPARREGASKGRGRLDQVRFECEGREGGAGRTTAGAPRPDVYLAAGRAGKGGACICGRGLAVEGGKWSGWGRS